jgi:hypothetical protein
MFGNMILKILFLNYNKYIFKAFLHFLLFFRTLKSQPYLLLL